MTTTKQNFYLQCQHNFRGILSNIFISIKKIKGKNPLDYNQLFLKEI
jgi:hypothetical protein